MLSHGITPVSRNGVHIFPSGQSRYHQVTQLRTDDVHCGESAGTGPVVLKVVPVTGAIFSGFIMDQLICTSLCPHQLNNWYKVGMYDTESIEGSRECVCACVCVCSSHEPIGFQVYPVIYAVANSVLVLLERKISDEHLQRSNESIKTKKQGKNDKNKGGKKQ